MRNEPAYDRRRRVRIYNYYICTRYMSDAILRTHE